MSGRRVECGRGELPSLMAVCDATSGSSGRAIVGGRCGVSLVGVCNLWSSSPTCGGFGCSLADKTPDKCPYVESLCEAEVGWRLRMELGWSC